MRCTAAFHGTIYVAAAAVKVTKINNPTCENSRSGDRKIPGYPNRFNTSGEIAFLLFKLWLAEVMSKTIILRDI